MDAQQRIADHFRAVSEVLATVDQEAIVKIVRYLEQVRLRSANAWIIGNGGSAATASHFANDLRKAALISAISLPDQSSTVTAYANDDGWVNMYSHALHMTYLRPTDCLIAISCSGRSANIVEAALQTGRDRTIVLTGSPGPKNLLAPLGGERVVYAQSDDIKVQESVHLAVCHAIVCGLTPKI